MDKVRFFCGPESILARYAKRGKEECFAHLISLLDSGVDLSELRSREIHLETPFPILERLLEHGWDINYIRMPNERPFLALAVKDVNLVQWCLGHGAKLHPHGQAPDWGDLLESGWRMDSRRRHTVLERAAAHGTTQAFDILLAQGAPLGWKPLQMACHAATLNYIDHPNIRPSTHYTEEQIASGMPDPIGPIENIIRAIGSEAVPPGMIEVFVDRADTYAERMAMVRHLVDVVGLDVNARELPLSERGKLRGDTPLFSCVSSMRTELSTDVEELYRFLLDRGADPEDEGMKYCNGRAEWPFHDVLKAWRAEQHDAEMRNRRRCCLQ